MSRWIVIGLFLLANLLAAGCGSDKDKNRNSDKDRPRSGEKSEPAKGKG
jgi:hypothetical protein